ncbi:MULTISPECIES: hypothetical protein [unclassified Hyphomicrobium]|uniref:hypothetical protein n=1 Tax=unclassified Hyphomicrobium TaxID=2619925 RepID=UPI000213ED88|nr:MULTISPECIES: hypothetical protein [unclassified Hyphomicrobium]CCB66058.1 conserved exported protein of unknown function [Hyphomicrobium sp. MC1]
MPVIHSRRSLLQLSAGAVAIILATLAFARFVHEPTAPPQKIAAQSPAPTLNCVFYDLTHANIVVSFDFAVAFPDGAPPRFDLRSQAMRDGNQVFDAGERPVWPYALDDDGAPAITSPDGAIRIVLFALEPSARGVAFVDAGLRSNEYRNLDGKCRQSDFGDSGHASAFRVPTGDAAQK